jgi:hypothetical protein
MDSSSLKIKKLLKIKSFTPSNLIKNNPRRYNSYGENSSHEVVRCGIFLKPEEIKNQIVKRIIVETIEIQVHVFNLNKTELDFCIIYLDHTDNLGNLTYPEQEFEICFWRKRGSNVIPESDQIHLFLD